MSVTQPLRDEHRELLPRIESLRAAAEAAESGGEGLGQALDEALAYASALAALTEEQEAGRLRISPLVITSGGELLTPATQRRAEAASGCLVTQSYAASEAMPLALPCRTVGSTSAVTGS